MRTRHWLAVVVAMAVIAQTALGWWDTQIQVAKPPPTVKVVQAEEATNQPGAATADQLAWGGKAVTLKANGPTLAFEADCAVSHYVLYVVARVPREDFKPPTPPVILNLRLTNLQNQQVRQWRQRVCVLKLYQDSGHLYVPIHEAGKYRFELTVGSETVEPIMVDYMALKDLFKDLPKVGQKSGQNLTTKAELDALRAQDENVKLAQKLQTDQTRAGLLAMNPEQQTTWRGATFQAVWDIIPPRNLLFDSPDFSKDPRAKALIDKAEGVSVWELKQGLKPRSVSGRSFILPANADAETKAKLGIGPWTFVHPKLGKTYSVESWNKGELAGDCAFPDNGTGYYLAPEKEGENALNLNWMGAGLMQNFRDLASLAVARSEQYLKTGNPTVGWEGVCALVAYVHMYPDIDYQVQRCTFNGGQFGNGTQPEMNPYGKFVYSGWAIDIEAVIKAYDHLFPIIQGNAELAQLIGQKIPWVKTPNDVIKLLDTNLLQHVRDCVDRQIIRAGDGASERVLGVAALVQGPGSASEWMWKLLFTRCHMRMINAGGLQDHFVSSLNQDGCNYIGSVGYTLDVPVTTAQFAEICRRYKKLGGKLQFDLSDSERFPKVSAGPYFMLDAFVAGGWMPHIGEWGGADTPPEGWRSHATDGRDVWLSGWRSTRDPRFAWMVNTLGRAGEPEAEWAQIQADAAKQGVDPVATNRTRNLPGFGMIILEGQPRQTDYRKKSALVLRTGAGQGHGDCDQLAIDYYDKGAFLLSDNGRRGGANNSHANRYHNVVEVDERDLLCTAYGRSGVGWSEAVADLQGVGYARASAAAPSHPYLKVYRRDAVLVPVGEEDSYVFDVFRVDGGKVHTWCSAGPIATSPTQVQFNVPMSKEPSSLAQKYLGPRHTQVQTGAAPDVLQVTWQVPPDKAARFHQLPKGAAVPEIFARAWHLGVQGLPVIQSYATISDYTKQAYDFNFVYLRRESKDTLSSTFATVTEGYINQKPVIQSVKEYPQGNNDAQAARVVNVTCVNGQNDWVVLGGTSQSEAQLPGAIKVNGQFGYISHLNQAVRQISLVGGQSLTAEGIILKPQTARYTAKVTGIDLATNSIELDQELPAGVLEGDSITVLRQAEHNAAHIVKKVQGKRLSMRGSIILYQTAVDYVDPASGRITPNLPPVLLETTRTFYNNLAMVNEAGKVLGRTQVMTGDRFMFLGYPEHWQWSQRLKPEDLGASKKLKLISATTVNKVTGQAPDGSYITQKLPPGTLMSTLDVTRLREDGLMIWFKDPTEQFTDSAGVPHVAWPYVGATLETETGKKIIAQYPGADITLAVAERKLTQADLPDTDKDGRSTVFVSDIAPGDTIDAPSRVTARLVKDGVWHLQANTGLTLQLPAKGKEVAIQITTGDKTTIRIEPANKEITIPVAAFAGGQVHVLTTPEVIDSARKP